MSSNLIKHTRYIGVRKFLISRFNSKIIDIIRNSESCTILDAGCGEGFISNLMADRLSKVSVTGLDVSESAIQYAQNAFSGITFMCGSIYEMPFVDNCFDTVLCSEVLEHLEDPSRALKEICRVSSGKVILTVPYEPFFRLGNLATFKYLKTFGNHPEHINHWNIRSFELFSENDINIIGCYPVFPWIVLEGEKK